MARLISQWKCALCMCVSVFSLDAYAEEPTENPPAQPAAAEQAATVLDQGSALPQPSLVLPDELHLRNVEERVGLLKEKIFQAKARLLQMQEIFMHGAITGSQLALSFRNTMGSAFELIKMECVLDGSIIYSETEGPDASTKIPELFDVFHGSVHTGSHVLNVSLEYRGNGHGILKYLNDYTFKVNSQYTFNAEQGRILYLRMVGYEKDDVTLELKDRPSVRYEIESLKGIRRIDKTPEVQSTPQK